MTYDTTPAPADVHLAALAKAAAMIALHEAPRATLSLDEAETIAAAAARKALLQFGLDPDKEESVAAFRANLAFVQAVRTGWWALWLNTLKALAAAAAVGAAAVVLKYGLRG